MTLTDFLSEHGVEYREAGQHEHARPGWLQVDAPCCGMVGHFRLGINLSSMGSSCWSCGRQRTIDTLMELTGQPFAVVGPLVKALRGGLPADWAAGRQDKRGKLVEPPKVVPMLPAHESYLRRKRGLDPAEMAAVWGAKGIGICPWTHLQWRVYIPIVWRGEVVSWTTRAIGEDVERRYWAASPEHEKYNHRHLLYGQDLVKQSVICCEGPLDVWSIGPGAVATFGTAITKQQTLKLAQYPKRVICFDAVEEAQKQARELCDALECFPGKTINVVLDTGKDAGECSNRELEFLRKMMR